MAEMTIDPRQYGMDVFYWVDFTLTGQRSALLHRDDIESQDEVKEWQNDPANKKKSDRGDDRSPAWLWQTYLYHDGVHVCCPREVLMANLMAGGAQVPTGKGTKSCKEVSQTGIFMTEDFYPLHLKSGRQIKIADTAALRNLPFSQQSQAVKNLGFSLFTKRVRISATSKHVRVRPILSAGWKITGRCAIVTDQLPPKMVERIWTAAGGRGLFDWRPGAPRSPGTYGIFRPELRFTKGN